MKPLKQKISITLDEDVIQKLKSLADGCDRSLSQYINLVLKEHLSRLDAEKESPTETL
ncbi:MAG TPA: TraY domain-containing protein [Candidatus Merdivicinus intestinavium]|nr:TraY domain-containing protein [Candidatus Merdivicinus intestinavium]